MNVQVIALLHGACFFLPSPVSHRTRGISTLRTNTGMIRKCLKIPKHSNIRRVYLAEVQHKVSSCSVDLRSQIRATQTPLSLENSFPSLKCSTSVHEFHPRIRSPALSDPSTSDPYSTFSA